MNIPTLRMIFIQTYSEQFTIKLVRSNNFNNIHAKC